MKYLLDTSICVFFFRNKYNIGKILQEKGLADCCISEITVAELRYGAENSANPEKHNALIDKFLERIVVVPIADSIHVYAKEKVRLNRAGISLNDDFDLLIAATAVFNKLTLITDNVRHFNRVDKIKIENWIER